MIYNTYICYMVYIPDLLRIKRIEQNSLFKKRSKRLHHTPRFNRT